MKKAITALTSVFLLGILSVYGLFRVVFCYPPRFRPTVRQIPDSNLYRAHKGKSPSCLFMAVRIPSSRLLWEKRCMKPVIRQKSGS